MGDRLRCDSYGFVLKMSLGGTGFMLVMVYVVDKPDSAHGPHRLLRNPDEADTPNLKLALS